MQRIADGFKLKLEFHWGEPVRVIYAMDEFAFKDIFGKSKYTGSKK